MKMKKYRVIGILVALVCLLTACAKGETGKISVGIDVLADQEEMVKTGLVGSEISFAATDFERALNVSLLESITITKLPNASDGVLRVGGSAVSVGQIISRANLSFLTFSFAGRDIRSGEFCFSTDGGYEMACTVKAVDKINYSPTLASVTDATLQVATYQNITVYGTLACYDPEGDAVRYEVVSRPVNGRLVAENSECSVYRYIPKDGFVGEDSFRYVAIDACGNYSEAGTVSITVKNTDGVFVFADLSESAYHVPAISLTGEGVMTSSELDGRHYFHPAETVSRLDFLIMAMKTLGLGASAPAEKTVFADDAAIPSQYRPHVNTAERCGYVCGKISASGDLIFAPNDPITVAEAAVLLANMTEMEMPTGGVVLDEIADIPAWAADAIHVMSAAGVLRPENGSLDAGAALTRGETARMLYVLRAWCD